MTEDRLAQIIRATADELVAAFNKTAAIMHEGSKGTARESPLLSFLQGRLPATVRAVGSSEVLDSGGTTSMQQDILIVDPSTPPFLNEGNQRVYPAECVHGVLEVKGRLNKHEVVDACNKIASVKRLPKIHYYADPLGRFYPSLETGVALNHRPTFGYVFAYKSQTKIETIADNVIDWCKVHSPEEWPDGVFILDRGTVGWLLDGVFQECVVPGSQVGFIESQEPRDVLLAMILNLNVAYVTAWMPPFKLHGYLPTAVLGVTKSSQPPEPTWPEQTLPPSGAH